MTRSISMSSDERFTIRYGNVINGRLVSDSITSISCGRVVQQVVCATCFKTCWLLYNLLYTCCWLSICCEFVVQQSVRQIHNKSKQWSPTLRAWDVWSTVMGSNPAMSLPVNNSRHVVRTHVSLLPNSTIIWYWYRSQESNDSEWLDFGGNPESFVDSWFCTVGRYSVRRHFAAYLSKLWTDFRGIRPTTIGFWCWSWMRIRIRIQEFLEEFFGLNFWRWRNAR